ncbi:ribokinase [Methylobacterium sp. Leaf94]|uniref:PfkB family carbohydrate kinase n=1 Tax=unclassified Methylobacterium TaxID=2615210 RepID=UPI0006FD5261|nr:MULTISPECIES: PfkB family carbohydrate kinase [unclassified Methylobacterium]KQO71676.1 ribokinase [Methylobacterium sp. Leaf89]KQU16506.1 ribokinase [Methylobacterium sp. Leaf94]
MRVFVIGSFVIACSVKVPRLPQAGESLGGSAFRAEPGGKGFNLALAAHRLGVGVDGLFAVGADVFSPVVRSTFAQVGFPETMLVPHAGSTGAGVAFVDPAGENCLAVCLGANLALTAADVRAAADRVAAADLVAATFESPDAPIREAFALARARGLPTLLNPSPMRPLDPAILADTTLLVVNGIEAAALGLGPAEALAETRRPTPAIAALLDGGLDHLVVTLGERGAVAFRPGLPPLRQPAFPVAAVDTVGAGDAFAAGLMAALLAKAPLGAALRRAAACGALATAQFGAFDAFPTAAALEAFLDGAGPDAASGDAGLSTGPTAR